MRPDQARKALPVVVVVCVLAVALGYWGFLQWPRAEHNIAVALVLVALGAIAEVIPYKVEDQRAIASVAFIPFAAAVFCFPDPRLIAFVAIGQAAVQVWHKRTLMKAVFNAAQFTLSIELAILVAGWVGIPASAMGTAPFSQTLLSWGLPGLAAFAALMASNKLAVAAVVSASSGQKLVDILLQNVRQLPVMNVFQAILALYLAWLAASLGVLGAAGMLLPMLAVRQLTRTTIQLTKVTEELLDLMVAAIEARDPYTSGHSKRVAASAVTIAKALNLKPVEVDRVQVAALLHDVGKIHEEFARILAKEGRLTPEEWEVMKRHPGRSAELIGLVTTLHDVVPGVRHHHENWDGTGYPAGIKGDAIPLASRIIMFADTLDAITTDRPYRKALDPEEARREFLKFRGKQFDPDICDVVASEAVWIQLYTAAKATKANTSILQASPVSVVA